MTFTPRGTGSHLRYVIEFGAVLPGLDRIVKRILQTSITKNLPRVDREA
jgi:hypothetical protein